MGVVAGTAELPADRWPDVLSALSAAGITVDDEGIENGIRCYRCRLNECDLCLDFGKVESNIPQGVMVYYPEWFLWRRPLDMWRLSRVVWSSVLAAGGRRSW
jgi:hypothetical protein